MSAVNDKKIAIVLMFLSTDSSFSQLLSDSVVKQTDDEDEPWS